MPDPLDAVLETCAAGRLSPSMATMRLLMEAPSPELARAALRRAMARAPAQPLRTVAELLESHPEAWERVRGVIGTVEHGQPSGDPLAHWAALFDRAVAVSPEGSVALYSLGSPDLLARATDEITSYLAAHGLVRPGATVLDVGCGIGRVAAALAPRVAAVIGLDISAGMIAEAWERCAGLANARFDLGTGRDLEGVADGSVDLVLFVDSFPYLMLSGDDLAAAHVAEAARVLRPDGRAAILNLSYRGDAEADRADLARFAGAAGLAVLAVDPAPFPSWDAPVYVLGPP